jgi:hypothetical protein
LGILNIELFLAYKMPHLHAISTIFANARVLTFGALSCRNIVILCLNEYVKVLGHDSYTKCVVGATKGVADTG